MVKSENMMIGLGSIIVERKVINAFLNESFFFPALKSKGRKKMNSKK